MSTGQDVNIKFVLNGKGTRVPNVNTYNVKGTSFLNNDPNKPVNFDATVTITSPTTITITGKGQDYVSAIIQNNEKQLEYVVSNRGTLKERRFWEK